MKDVQERLKALAAQSPSSRQQVIMALIEFLEKTFSKPKDSLLEGAACNISIRLLGELRATQAIDLLVRYVDYNDGTAGLSLSHIPAAQALVQIGDPSVPKLTDALRHGNSDWTGDRSMYRFAAAAALGEMHRQDPAN